MKKITKLKIKINSSVVMNMVSKIQSQIQIENDNKH